MLVLFELLLNLVALKLKLYAGNEVMYFPQLSPPWLSQPSFSTASWRNNLLFLIHQGSWEVKCR